MFRRSAVVIAVSAALLLAGCGIPTPIPPTTTTSPAPGVDEADGEPEAEGRLGWRIVFTNVLGAHQPKETCGGDYVLRRGFAGAMYPDYIDDEGLEGPPNDSPIYSVAINSDGVMWYVWMSGKFTWEEAPGSPSQGEGAIELDADGDGHPDPTVTAAGGTMLVVDQQLAWETRRGADTVSVTFERIPEPAWCVEDEAFNLPFDDEMTWHYYD